MVNRYLLPSSGRKDNDLDVRHGAHPDLTTVRQLCPLPEKLRKYSRWVVGMSFGAILTVVFGGMHDTERLESRLVKGKSIDRDL
jgi:hypothetical protein